MTGPCPCLSFFLAVEEDDEEADDDDRADVNDNDFVPVDPINVAETDPVLFTAHSFWFFVCEITTLVFATFSFACVGIIAVIEVVVVVVVAAVAVVVVVF